MEEIVVGRNSSYQSGISLAFSPVVTALYIIIYIPVFIGTVIGNFLVIAAFIKNKRLRKVQNYFVVSLALTDFLTGLFALPMSLAPRLIISPVTCYETPRFNFFLPSFVFSGSSIYHLSAIAIDRLISVYFPFRYPRIVTPCRVRIALLVIWVYNVLFGFIPFFLPGGETDRWVCGENYDAGEQDIAVVLVGIAVFIMVYFIGMLLLYAVLLRKARQHLRKHSDLIAGSTTAATVHSEAKSRFRGVVTMAIVVGAFGVCWLPTSFQFLFEIYFVYDASLLILVQTLCEYPAFVNSMVNPVIYALRNKEFSAGMRGATRCATIEEARRTQAGGASKGNTGSSYISTDSGLTRANTDVSVVSRQTSNL